MIGRRYHTFPVLDEGTYIGEITQIFDGERGVLPFVLTYKGISGFEPEKLFLIALPTLTAVPFLAEKTSIKSLQIFGERFSVARFDSEFGTFVMSGIASGSNSYRGKVTLTVGENVRHGNWSMIKSQGLSRHYSAAELEVIGLWLDKRAELAKIEIEEAKFYDELVRTEGEIKRLSYYVDEREMLRANSKNKFKETLAELKKVREDSGKAREELKDLYSRMSLTQKLSSFGRLAALSRELLNRQYDLILLGQIE
ncbi:MAG TPA: hypothetical protein PKD37_04585 [Oligoflexia bacterium]|nr:hypothetical protein [Oligoflexia bacterium]